MTPETAEVLMNGILYIVVSCGILLCIYAFIKGLFGGYRYGG